MPIIKCEMCGSTDIIKQDGVFVCQSCGIKYSLEEAKKLMVEVSGTVEVKGSVKVENAASTESLLKRAFMMLEDGDDEDEEDEDEEDDAFDKASELLDRVLNIDPECAEAYLGKLLLEYGLSKEADLTGLEEPFDSSKNYQKIMKFGSAELRARMIKINNRIIAQNDEKAQLAAEKIMSYSVRAARMTIAAGGYCTIALKRDGTVVTTEGNSNVSSWRNIIAVSAGRYHEVGLKADGTVVAEGDNNSGQCNVSGWRNIVAVSAGEYHTVGLKADGTVVVTGNSGGKECDVSEWKNVVAISAGFTTTIGLKSDGTLIATDNLWSRVKVKSIVAISAASLDALYLLSTGEARYYGKTIAKDLIGISSSENYLVGLKSDGTVTLVNHGYKCDKLDVSGWKDIVAVSAGLDHIVGLKSDGTVVTAGKNNSGQCNVSKWKDIMLPSTASTFEEDRREKISLIASEFEKSKDSRDAFNLAIMRASIRNSRKPICVNYMNLAVLKSDGTVAVTGSNGSGQCRTADFYDIVAVSTNIDYTTGLRADGTLTFTKHRAPWMSYDGRIKIESIQAEALKWRDIVAIDNGGNARAPIAINAFGKVLVTYNERWRLKSALEWKDIVAISRCGDELVGLNASGKVLMTGGGAGYDAENWEGIIAISAGGKHIVGLKSDGSVVATGENDKGQCNVGRWRDIIEVVASVDYTVGLKSDGTVVSTGSNYNARELLLWKDIVAISASWTIEGTIDDRQHYGFIVGLKSDGSIVTSGGRNTNCSTMFLKKIMPVINASSYKEYNVFLDRIRTGVCQYCGGTFKGLFSPKCSVCGKSKDY